MGSLTGLRPSYRHCPSTHTLRQVWARVCWALEREEALTLAGGRSEVLRLFAQEVRMLTDQEGQDT